MNLYLVRHTESVDNKSRVVSRDGSPLSPKGLIQAEKLGKKLSKKIKATKIWTSPLRRTKQTAKIIASFYPKLKVIERKEIAEKKDASSLIGKTREEIPWDLIIKNRLDPNWKHEDGESFNEVRERIKFVFNKLEECPSNAKVLAITHNSFIKHLVAYVVLGDKFSPETFYPFADRLGTKNGSVTILEQKQKYYETKPSWYLKAWMSW